MVNPTHWKFPFGQRGPFLYFNCYLFCFILLNSFILLTFCMTFEMCAAIPSARMGTLASDAIVPADNWMDTNGKSIQAHGAGIIQVGRTYYWFGENRAQNNSSFAAVSCYSSTDLVHWTFRSNVLTLQSSGDLGPNRVVERPKVVYNAPTYTYVMYLHIDSPNYGEAKVGVATSKTIDGNYSYIGSYNPRGNQSRDMTVFQDTDGSAYLIYATNNNSTLNIDKLSPDYMDDVSNVYSFNNRWEAPGMFKSHGRYYLICSSPTGWAPNPNVYVSATSLSGPWTSPASLAPNSLNTYEITGCLYSASYWQPRHDLYLYGRSLGPHCTRKLALYLASPELQWTRYLTFLL